MLSFGTSTNTKASIHDRTRIWTRNGKSRNWFSNGGMDGKLEKAHQGSAKIKFGGVRWYSSPPTPQESDTGNLGGVSIKGVFLPGPDILQGLRIGKIKIRFFMRFVIRRNLPLGPGLSFLWPWSTIFSQVFGWLMSENKTVNTFQ